MDDLKRHKINKMIKILDKIELGFNNEIRKIELENLLDRKNKLENVISSDTKNNTTIKNAKLQLKDVELSIEELYRNINYDLNFDTNVDEHSAVEFINNNSEVFIDAKKYVDSNSVLDELEKTLGLEKKDES